MNIYFNSSPVYYFQDSLNSVFASDRSKTIFLIASLALSALAIYYTIRRCCHFKATKIDSLDQDDDQKGEVKDKKNIADKTKEEDAQNWLEKADNFLPSSYRKPAKRQMFLDYIQQILKNPDFQKDSHAFMKKWEKERGATEESRFPEDLAMRFFHAEIKNQSKESAI